MGTTFVRSPQIMENAWARRIKLLVSFAPSHKRLALYAVAACSLVAAVIHYWLIPEHYNQWWGYGVFFTVSAIAQAFFCGAVVLWPSRRIFVAGTVLNAGLAALYLWTRTVGIPLFGPDAGSVEHVESWMDIVCVLVELAAVGLLIALLRGRSQPVTTSAHPLL